MDLKEKLEELDEFLFSLHKGCFNPDGSINKNRFETFKFKVEGLKSNVEYDEIRRKYERHIKIYEESII